MEFDKFIAVINELSKKKFVEASESVVAAVDDYYNFYDLVSQIGIIPESIAHDSTGEKLFSKASDAVLARAFREMGLQSTVLSERRDSADVVAKSKRYGYQLVADAKSFRMSRTAKNQKDFKVNSLSGWRKESEYAVLCAPYFQYPSTESQIYQQAITENVCLIGWEHIAFFISNNIKESDEFDFSNIWNYSNEYSKSCICSNMKKYFISKFDRSISSYCNIDLCKIEYFLDNHSKVAAARGAREINFLENEIEEIKNLSHEQAIAELLKAKKIEQKINQINLYIKRLRACVTR